MPPRKSRSKGSARAKAIDSSIPQPIPLPKDPESPSPPRSPIQTVYEIPELFQRILHFVSQHDLTRVIRVERALIPLVAAELYRTVDFANMQSALHAPHCRNDIYRGAVRTMKAYDMPLSPAWQKAVGFDSTLLDGETHPYGRKRIIIEHLQAYHPHILEKLLPLLRESFPRLRTAYFGQRHGCYDMPQWTVHFCPRISEADAGGSTSAPSSLGHIEYATTIVAYLAEKPLTSAPPPPSPVRNFTISTRFDLSLRSDWGHHTPEHITSWQQALKNTSCFGSLYETVSLGDLPVTLGDIAALYQRQTAAGHANRMWLVAANRPTPFDTLEFDTFARIAGRSLRRLELGWHHARPHLAKIHLSDLPSFTHTVRTHLPNLCQFDMAMNGIATAEAECRKHLHSGILSSGGNVNLMRIFVDRNPTTDLYNVLRCFYPICGSRLSMHMYIGCQQEKDEWGSDTQTAFVRYLQKQSPQRRYHLSTVDFKSLDIVSPRDVFALSYDDQDRPIRRWIDQSAKWQGDIQETNGAISAVQKTLEEALKEVGELSTQMKAMSWVEREAEKEQKVTERLLEVVRGLSMATEQLSSKLANGLEKDLASYLRVPVRIRDLDKQAVREKAEDSDSYEDYDYY